MPHITMRILSTLTNEQKKSVADKMADALCEAIGCSADHVTVSVEEYEIEDIQKEHSVITLKMLEGRTPEQKQDAAQAIVEVFYQNTDLKYQVDVRVIDYTPEEWQEVYAEEIDGNNTTLVRKPHYDPKDLLKK